MAVVIAKSLGTNAAAWANARGYAGVWLTPLLGRQSVRDPLTVAGPQALSIGGTNDRVWDRDVATRLPGTVLEVEGADHALHIGSDWRASLAALDQTMDAIQSLLRAQLTE